MLFDLISLKFKFTFNPSLLKFYQQTLILPKMKPHNTRNHISVLHQPSAAVTLDSTGDRRSFRRSFTKIGNKKQQRDCCPSDSSSATPAPTPSTPLMAFAPLYLSAMMFFVFILGAPICFLWNKYFF